MTEPEIQKAADAPNTG